LLETIRQFAQEKLVEAGEVEVARDRHARHYEGVIEGLPADDILPAIDANQGNVVAAIEWLAERDPPAAVNLSYFLAASPTIAVVVAALLSEIASRVGPESPTGMRARAFTLTHLIQAGEGPRAFESARELRHALSDEQLVEQIVVRESLGALTSSTPDVAWAQFQRAAAARAELRGAEQDALIRYISARDPAPLHAICVMAARRYEEAVGLFPESPVSGWPRPAYYAIRAASLHLAGAHQAGWEAARLGIEAVTAKRSLAFAYAPFVTGACCLASLGDPAGAGAVMTRACDLQQLARLPFAVADLLGSFARLRLLNGERGRAQTLAELWYPRQFYLAPLVLEVYADLEEWPDGEWVQRGQARVVEFGGGDRLATLDERGWPYLLEELEYWGKIAEQADPTAAGVS
jgi:hypothetical protein